MGLIGNNGPIDADGAAKAGQFIQLMCQAGSPIIYLHNITGFLVGVDAERGGIVKHGAKMLQAVANATVPQITLHIGASFGAGNFGMCGRSLEPRFIFAWPNNRIAVMGGEQAAKVMTIITEESRSRRGQEIDRNALDIQERQLIDQFDRDGPDELREHRGIALGLGLGGHVASAVAAARSRRLSKRSSVAEGRAP